MRIVLLLALAIFSSSCSAQQADGWKEFVAEDAGFTVILPCSPEKTTQEYNYSVGKRYGYEYLCSHDGIRFKIDFGDHNPETGESVQKFLEYSTGGIELAFKDFIKEKNDISIDGFAGRRFLMNPGRDMYLITAVTSNKKGILHATVGPVAMPVSAEAEQIFKKVIDSIKFHSR